MTTIQQSGGVAAGDARVIVIGGGPAGLQAALTLARMHHDVTLLDGGSYRNDPADAMHNIVGYDGRKPAEFRAAARADLAAYRQVRIVETTARAVTAVEGGFVVRAAEDRFVAPRLILATGARDALPQVPGLDDLWGSVAAHCPYCHGHEYAGTHVGILNDTPHVVQVAMLLRRIAARLTVFTSGAALAPEAAVLLDRLGVAVRTEEVVGVCRSSAGARVSLASGPDEELGGLMVAPVPTLAAPFAEQLGLAVNPSGFIRIDGFGRTSLPGVYAAGDAAHRPELPMPMAAVTQAVAAGMLAATAIDQDEIAEAVGALAGS